MESRLNHALNLDKYKCRGAPCTDMRLRLYVKQTDRGELWHCHNCGASGFIPKGNLTPTELIKYLNSLSVIPSQSGEQREIKLPYDFSEDLPKNALQWFYKYGLFKEDITRFHFGFSAKYNRIILPVFTDETLVYYQSRSLDKPTKENPKYINVRQSGAKNVFFRNFSFTEKPELVVVEDILSAVKVGKVTNSVSLLGSYMPDSFYDLCDDFNKIWIWLDRDKLRSSIKYANKLRLKTGKQVKVVVMDKDPKEYSVEEVEKIIY